MRFIALSPSSCRWPRLCVRAVLMGRVPASTPQGGHGGLYSDCLAIERYGQNVGVGRTQCTVTETIADAFALRRRVQENSPPTGHKFGRSPPPNSRDQCMPGGEPGSNTSAGQDRCRISFLESMLRFRCVAVWFDRRNAAEQSTQKRWFLFYGRKGVTLDV